MSRKQTGNRRRRRSTPPRHHSVYVVELDRAASPDRDSALPPLYVGMTGLAPEARFANHKRGHKSSRVVRKHGVRLLPSLYADLNPMSYARRSGWRSNWRIGSESGATSCSEATSW
jgi:hypothetical protein